VSGCARGVSGCARGVSGDLGMTFIAQVVALMEVDQRVQRKLRREVFSKVGQDLEDWILAPILPKTIFPTLHILVRFSYKYV
jgi:hypothetical protein